MATLIPGVGYKRVSRTMGRSGPSFISEEVQEADIMRAAAENGIQIVKWYSEVDVSGGAIDGRDEFPRVLADVKNGEVGAVVVATLSRAFRNLEDAMRERRLIREAGGEMVAADVPHLAGAIGERLYVQQAAEDHLFLVGIKERWAKNRQTALANGVYFGNVPPTGYQYERPYDTPEAKRWHHLIPVEELREPVRAIFIGRAAGRSWKSLADDFTAATGITIRPDSLDKLIRNRAYRGESHAKGLEPNLDAHEPLVSEAEWQAAQPKHVRAARPARSGDSVALLTGGVLRCGSCRQPMSYRGGKGKQYTCQRIANGTRCEAPVLIAGDRIDAYVLELVRAKAEGLRVHKQPSHDRQRELDGKVRDAELELELYLEETSAVEVGRESFRKGKDKRVAALAAAREQRDRELAGADLVDEEFVSLVEVIDSLDPARQQRIVARLLDSVTVHRQAPGVSTHAPIGDRVEVVWNPALG